MRKFTLIELLVVIAVIGILLSFLIPTLASARRKGQTRVSTNNLKQLSNSVFMYTGDNGSQYPPARMSPSSSITWEDLIATYLNINLSQADMLSEIMPWRSSMKVFQCPLDDVPSWHSAFNRRSYSPNGYSRDAQTPAIFKSAEDGESLRFPEIDKPTETILIADFAYSGATIGTSGNCSISNAHIQFCTTEIQDGISNPNHHRNGSKNPLLFVDGHVKTTNMLLTLQNGNYLWSSKK